MTTTPRHAANRFQPIDPQPDALPMPNQTGGELRLASNLSDAGRHSGVARRSVALCISIPDRYFAKAVACDSVGVIVAGRGTGNDDGNLERRDDRGVG